MNDLEETDSRPSHLLVVLADGMGGHSGGAHASAVAVDTFLHAYQSAAGSVTERMLKSLNDSNERIRVDAEGNTSLAGMGCTLVGAAFMEDGLVWISVGDSPFWRYRDGSLKQLNEDHSMAPLIAQQVVAGALSPEEAARHPHRNALRSALIGEPIPKTDLRESPIRLKPGDKFVLASDGLQTLSEQEIAAILREDADALDLARKLLRAVDEKKLRGQDNTTAIVVTPFRNGDAPPIVDWTL
ncbi:MAG: serine/threonine-protein phosphatase [Rhodospirillaceae bacterium]|nr:serine/threonine-protein phosphatase [Rhodospirillaceae bacterium]